MKTKEPKFMKDLHKVREKLAKRWSKLSPAEIVKEANSHKIHKAKKKAA